MRPQVLAATLTILSLVLVIIIIERYQFHDCKNVGHTTAYCLLDIIF